MEREVAPISDGVFQAAVCEGRDSAIRVGFTSIEDATHWARRMSTKILSNQRHVAKECGRIGFIMRDHYVELES